MELHNFFRQLPLVVLGCVHAYFAKAESAFWNADSKRPIQNAVKLPGLCSSSSRKGVYMTSFKRGYNVIFAFMLPPESAFCSNHDRKCTFLKLRSCLFCEGVLNADQNADPKRRFTEVLFMLPSRRRRYVYRRRHVSEFSECLIQSYCSSSSELGKAFIWRHLNVVIMWFCVHASTRIQRFALTTFVNAHFWAFESAFWTRLFENKHGRQQRFALTTFDKRWFWPQKLSFNTHPGFESAVLKRVYSKISIGRNSVLL